MTNFDIYTLSLHDALPIFTEIFEAYRKVLQKVFAGRKEDETEENIQSRARGMMLMALSNKFGAIVLRDRKSTRLNSSHRCISYAVFCLKKKIPVDIN